MRKPLTLGICVIPPSYVRAGEIIRIKLFPRNVPWHARARMFLASSSGPVMASRWSKRRFSIDTTGLAPGMYSVKAYLEVDYALQADAVATFLIIAGSARV